MHGTRCGDLSGTYRLKSAAGGSTPRGLPGVRNHIQSERRGIGGSLGIVQFAVTEYGRIDHIVGGRSKMPRQGRELERLVRVIEQAIHIDERITVESPKMLRDIDTGRMREHDVVLTIKLENHTLLIALECKDTKAKVGSPQVEAFVSKCQRTGVSQGTIVSSKGFTKPGRRKAAAHTIGCFTLDEAINFNWCLATGMKSCHREIKRVHLKIESGSYDNENLTLHKNNGEILDKNKFKSDLGMLCLGRHTDLLNKKELKNEPVGVVIDKICVNNNPDVYLKDENNKKYKVRSLKIFISYLVREGFIPFSFHTYGSGEESVKNYQIASVNINCPEFAGRFMIINEGERGKKVVFVPEKPEGDDKKLT